MPGTALPDWLRAHGPVPARGRLRATPEDFFVDEFLPSEPTGDGPHWWLRVEKTGQNTAWVARQVAAAAGCPARDVGFAGLKDRHALTRQWFSVPGAPADGGGWLAWSCEGVRVLEAAPSRRKIQRGFLAGNRFRLRITGLEGDREALEARLGSVRDAGVPNYFGAQRFGHGGANVERGLAWLARPRRIPRDKRGLYLSAVRSFLFNEVLAERVRDGSWNRLLPGERAMLAGRTAHFACEAVDAELVRRCEAFELHPTGPLPGAPGDGPMGEVAALEARVLGPHAEAVEALAAQRVDAARRALRLVPGDLAWQGSPAALELAFTLPPGAYATSVVRELIDTESDP